MKKLVGAVLAIVVFLSASCIFGPTSKRVMSYRNDKVYLSDRSYFTVGALPESWKRMRVQAHAIAFHNSDLKATIATDAFCGPSYEDISLKLLTSHMLAGIADYQIEETKEFILDDRGALRTVASGKVDGIPLVFDIVVIKKNKCNIDLMCMAPQGDYPLAAGDFEHFFSSFHYE